MNIPILSLLICVPTVGALFILFTKSTEKYNSHKYISIFISLIILILSIYLWYKFDNSNSSFQFVETEKLIYGFINYKVGVDNINFICSSHNFYYSVMYTQ